MGSLSRTAEPKAALLQAKKKHNTKETNNCDTKKRKDCTMVGLFQLRAGALLAILATTQCSAGDDSSSSSSLISKQPAPAMTHSAYFTEMMGESTRLQWQQHKPQLRLARCWGKELEEPSAKASEASSELLSTNQKPRFLAFWPIGSFDLGHGLRSFFYIVEHFFASFPHHSGS